MHTIIGGGPTGSYAAYLLARAGLSVQVYEEHKEIGLPVQCTGLLTSDFASFEKPDPSYIKNITKEIAVVGPEKTLYFKKKEYLIDRTYFDRFQAERAMSEGAQFHLGEKCTSPKGITIGADGANSKIARLLNHNPPSYFRGFQATVKGSFDPDTYTVHVGDSISPGLFGWVVPEDEAHARVGLKGTAEQFKSFLKMVGGETLSYQAGRIPRYDPSYRTERKDLYLLGDAALQVKATTGGGILMGMRAATCLRDAILKNKSYERLWKEKLGRNLWLHLKIRTMLDTFCDKDWMSVMDALSCPHVRQCIEKESRESPLAMCMGLLWKKPSLLRFVGKLL